MAFRTRKRVASSKPWTIGAAGGTTDAVYVDMFTSIEVMIGVIAIGGIATGTERRGLSGVEIQRASLHKDVSPRIESFEAARFLSRAL
jgi:hypothetical protein